MRKKQIINLEKIPQSAKKESSYKNFPIPEIIFKPNNKIFLLPRIKNLNKINFEIFNNINKKNENNKNNIKVNNVAQTEELILSENNRIKYKKSKKKIHNVIINSENYPKLLNNIKNKKINTEKLKYLLNQNSHQNNKITEENKSRNKLIILNDNKNLPKLTISSDKMHNKFRDGRTKLRERELKDLARINNKIINDNSNNENDIFKSTEVFPSIKVGCKYDPDDKKTFEEEEKAEFNQKIKEMMNKISKHKTRSRNNPCKNCYEILDYIKKKKTYNCEKLIEKTSEEVKQYQQKINNVYNNLKKTFEEGQEWNNLETFYDSN